MGSRKVYLQQMPWEEALNMFQDKIIENNSQRHISTEIVAVEDADGKVTCEAVYSKISSPHYRAAAMDGVAVKSGDTFGAFETSPVYLDTSEQAVEIDTGDPLPEDKDAVIKIEDIHYTETGQAEITSAAVPWQNVRPVGEDMVATEMLLPSNHKITPYDIGALLAGGITEVKVHKNPSVAILPTGTELIEPGEKLQKGSIIEYNSRVISALVKSWGGVPYRLQKEADDYTKIKNKIQEAVKEHDVIIINAGSSAGKEDYTSKIIDELGELLVHGAAIKPGKPVVLGIVQNKPVIGIPGYPVSATLDCELFVKPVIYKMLHLPVPERRKINCKISRRLYSSLGAEEFVRVTMGEVGGELKASPLGRGAGVITSLVKAQGILKVPRLSEGFEAGEEVEVELLTSLDDVKNSTVMIGSHDLSLDVINDYMHCENPGCRVTSTHVGSLAGLNSLKRGEAHAAGIHLLNPETGDYNISYVKKYLPQKKVKLVNLVYREQGLLVEKGNPYNITGLESLTRDDITYINRQKGAGTRILFDYLLQKEGISPSKITGYTREEFTHLNIGIAVASGSATCGMGIKTAADALGLDFIPVTKERYDICIPEEYYEEDAVKRLLEIINNTSFIKKLQDLGYDTSCTGEVISIA